MGLTSITKPHLKIGQSFEMSAELENESVEGWADAMSKVLGKQASKDASSSILGKTKTQVEDDDEVIEKRARRKKVKVSEMLDVIWLISLIFCKFATQNKTSLMYAHVSLV